MHGTVRFTMIFDDILYEMLHCSQQIWAYYVIYTDYSREMI